MFRLTVACNLQFLLHGTHPTEKACKNIHIPKTYTQRHLLFLTRSPLTHLTNKTCQKQSYPQPTHRGKFKVSFVPPFSCRRFSDFRWTLMSRWILACKLQFLFHGTHPTEKACQQKHSYPQNSHRETVPIFDSVPIYPSYREDLSKNKSYP